MTGFTAIFRALANAIAAAGVLHLCACATGGGGIPVADTGNRVKVGLLLPMTASGNTADVAKALKQAGELALFDFDNPNIQLVAKDTRGTADGARQGAQEAVSEGAELIIGPLTAGEVAAAAPAARLAGIPVVAFSTDEQVAGGGVYLLSFLAGRDVPRIVSYAASRGKRRFAALIPKTAYGRIAERMFKRAVSRAGGQIAVAAEFSPSDPAGARQAARQVAQAVRSGKADAIFLPIGQEELPVIAPALAELGLTAQNVTLLGTGRWDSPAVQNERVLQGGFYPGADPKGWNSFVQRYAQTFGGTPPRIASLAYDAVSLAVSLSSNPPGQRYTSEQLTRTSGFAGVDGLFRLLPDGTSERGLAILQVNANGPRVVDPAPRSFGSAQY